MADMTRAAALPGLGSEYDNFLFADIGADNNGTLLSVLSALARLDLDPWQEAARLNQLPGAAAIERLTSLIAAVSDKPPSEPSKIATRLVALLPRRTPIGIPSRKTLLAIGPIPRLQVAIYVIFLLIALVLAAEWFVSSPPSLGHVGRAHTSSSGTASSLNSDR
jgi:hypothetical protein